MLKVAALNVAIQDQRQHNGESYYRLFEVLAKLNNAFNYYGENRLLLSMIWEDENDNKRLIGTLDRFTDLETFAWYNRDANRPATPEERQKINVPENMRANYRGVNILFDCREHRIVFPTYAGSWTMSPQHVLKLFRALLDDARVREKFGTVSLTLEQEPSTLDRILNAQYLRYLKIQVYKPNSSFGRFDESFKDQMDAMQASKIQYEVEADDRNNLKPSLEVREAAKIALDNGVVEARIIENGLTSDISTRDFPVTEAVAYSSDDETAIGALRRAADAIIRRILNKAP